MYATLSQTTPADGSATPTLLRRFTTAAGEPGPTFAVWRDGREAAAGAPRQPVWAVTDHQVGRAADAEPTAVQATWFDGPRTDAQTAAHERAGRERLWPAVADADGIVDVFVLRGPQKAAVVLAFVTDARHLEEIQRRIMSTELLPGEDPDLLTGPDRIEIHRVAAAVPTAGGLR